MTLVATDAVVLHAFDYLETSRILRLATRDAGVQSVLARGARRSRARFGAALDLFASGVARLTMKPGRDLHTLTSFEVDRARPRIAAELERFAAAAAVAELVLRFGHPEGNPAVFDALVSALDALDGAPEGRAAEVALAGCWRIVAELGVAPTLDECASCGTPLSPDATVRFSHPSGGVVCDRCAQRLVTGRPVPPDARDALRRWIGGEAHPIPDEAHARAHRRLLREFLTEHLADERPLRAFDAWVSGELAGA